MSKHMSLFLLPALVLLPLLAHAIPTGLNIMPTAEVLGLGESRFDFETKGTGKLYATSDSTITGTQSGLILGFEVGADQVSDKGQVYNIKWRFKGEGILTPAIAVGAQNITSGEKLQLYVVASKSLIPLGELRHLLQISGGVLRENNIDKTLTMYGAGATLGPITVKADKVNGSPQDRSALGASLDMRGFTVTGTVYNFENAPDEKTLMLSYSTKAF